MANQLTAPEAESWYKVITDFPNYFSNFEINYNALRNQRDYVLSRRPELTDEYNSLMVEGDKRYQQLLALRENVGSVSNAFASAGTTITDWISEAKNSVSSWFGFGNLGIVPIIWAGMAAGTAIGILSGVAVWLSNTANFASRIEEAKRLEAIGMAPEQVTATLNERYGEPGGESFLGIPTEWLKWGAIGIGVIMLYPIVRDMFAKGRR